jgi:pyruvate carboxylase
VFRVFDALNDLEQMRPALQAVQDAGKVAEGTLCYTGDLTTRPSGSTRSTTTCAWPSGSVEAGSHVLAVKDMAGLLRPAAADRLVRALRERFDAPVHLHTHDTTGGQLATLIAAVHAGVDAVDCAARPFSGGTSQPNLSALVAATDHTERATGLDLAALSAMEPFWEAVRDLYAPFEAGLRAPTGTVYRHEIPGGQLTNLRQQAISLGLGDRWPQVQELYAVANDLLGKPIKVTPTSKVVGDLALFLAGSDVDPEALRKDPRGYDLPDSVLGYLGGELGTPPAGFPEPFRSRAVEGRPPVGGEVPLTPEQRESLEGPDRRPRSRSCCSPSRTTSTATRSTSGATCRSSRPRRSGTAAARAPAQGRARARGRGAGRAGDHRRARRGRPAHAAPARQRPPRPITVRDRSAEVKSTAARRADPSAPGHVGSPLPGVVMLKVAVGDTVKQGQPLVVVEAMKMESTVTSPRDGTVQELAVVTGLRSRPGTLWVVLG